MKPQSFARSIFVSFAMATASAAGAQGDNQFGHSPSALEGSWEVVLRAKNCTTGTEVPANLWSPGYQSFNAGGTMLETTSVPRFMPGQRGPGVGYWQRTDVNTHEAVFQAFILFDGDPTAIPPNPYKRGHLRIEQAITFLDADHWQSDARTFFRDANGNLYMQGCANFVATRMP